MSETWLLVSELDLLYCFLPTNNAFFLSSSYRLSFAGSFVSVPFKTSTLLSCYWDCIRALCFSICSDAVFVPENRLLISLTRELSLIGFLAKSEISLLSSLRIFFCSVFLTRIDGFLSCSLTEMFLLRGFSNLWLDLGLLPLCIRSS